MRTLPMGTSSVPARVPGLLLVVWTRGAQGLFCDNPRFLHLGQEADFGSGLREGDDIPIL